ncbi:protein kinase [Clostridium fallax]|uniref:Protein kinase n=1 Tax=Clostridium fallax TaxID=1533 RepID=A0A1M4WWF0_9CLOT|nr:protein kinase [Clostridium fallax]SHE85530.1 hypothetical protein SAMN05443638_11452 [Clostridium fallax]SQB07443.1 serine/threonine kinase [Clostridium fallax]
MVRHWDYSVELSNDLEKDLKKGKLLAEGHEGIVFLLPNNRILKIFREEKIWRDELYILTKTKGSKYFPKVYEANTNYIVREYVKGERLDDYIKINGLSKELALKLYYMLMEFKKLKFRRIDIRCKDIYVSKDKIKIIDPKNNYKKVVGFPRHLMKGLKNLNVLDKFLKTIYKKDKKLAKEWKEHFENYIKFKFK